MSEQMVVIGKGTGCEKDLILISRVSEIREEVTEKPSEIFSLDVRGGNERLNWMEVRILPVGLMFMIL